MADDIQFKEYEENIEALFPPKSRYTFLVGAGISMDPPTNMPSARQIVRNLLELCAPPEEVENLLSLDMLRFELVVEKIQDIFDEDLKFLDYLEYVTEPNIIHLFLSNAITRGNYVVTTNFDYLIEQALMRVLGANWHQDIIPVISKEDFIFYQDPKNLINSSKYPLYKIHGSKYDIITGKDTRESLITTMSALGKDREGGETFAIEPYKKPAVFNLMNERTLVVMGYSGSDDFDIGPALREMPFLNRLIWIDHSQKDQIEIIKMKKKEKLIFSENQSHLEQLLEEISFSGDFEVILIKTNTSKFIHTNLWKIFLPYLPVNEINLRESEKKIPKFSEWVKSLYEDVPSIEKYKFACQLFYYLKELKATKRCSEKGILLAEETNDITSKSYFLNFLGMINQITGNYERALKNYENAFQIDESLKDIAGKATDLNNIGSIFLTLGKYDEALENYYQALEIVDGLGDLSRKAACKNNIGRLHEIRNELDLALNNYLEAVKITEEVGDLSRKTALLNNIGMIYKNRDEYNTSLEYYNEALRISDLLGDLYGKVILLNNIGRVYDEYKNYGKALEKYNEAVQIAEQLGDLSEKAGSLNNIGSVYLAQGSSDMALEKYREALHIEERLGDPLMQVIYLNNMGTIHNNRAEYDLALEKYSKALSIVGNIGDLSKKALFLTKIASIKMIREEYWAALEKYENAILIFEELGELSNKAASLSNIGKIYEKFGSHNKAIEAYEESFQIDERIGDSMGKASDLYNLGRLHELHGEYRRALQNFEESSKIFTQLAQKQYVNVIKQKISTLREKIGISKF